MKLNMVGACLVVLSTFGCSGSGEEAGAAGGIELSPGPGAFTNDFASSPDFFTRMSEPQVGLAALSPHEKVQIWYSTNLEPAVGADSFTSPEGTVAIKAQSYDDDKNYKELLVMVKGKSGSRPETDDWTYEVRNAEGKLVGPSDEGFCANCHSAFPETGNLAGIVLEN